MKWLYILAIISCATYFLTKNPHYISNDINMAGLGLSQQTGYDANQEMSAHQMQSQAQIKTAQQQGTTVLDEAVNTLKSEINEAENDI